MKYIFVTGGVVSSLGKGLTAASLGTLLEARRLRVVLQKFDPYLNVDPGTMNPFQHGEVYVLNDGAETDLDLGHYERFTNCVLTRHNNLTSGQVYETVILKERRGDYLGKPVQVDRHVRRKLSMFCIVSEKAVIEERDVELTIYEVPLTLHAEGLDALVCDLLHLETPEPDLADWRKFVERVVCPKRRVKIAVVGKYMDVRDAYKSIYESLTHAAGSEDCGIDLKLIDAESL